MPLQNRVTPFGEIVAVPQRGLFTGNRGIIHDPRTKTLLSRRWTSKAWLICSCEYKGVRREVMATQSWTELFFLDEVTALAAGHRPCFACRREAVENFRGAWARAKNIDPPSVPTLDAVLHAERLEGKRKRIHPLDTSLGALPDGTMVALGPDAYAIFHGRAHRWSASGYSAAVDIIRAEGLLTPPSTVAALRAGFKPVIHPTLLARLRPGQK